MKNPIISSLFVAAFATTLSAQCSRWNPQTDFPPAQQLVEFLAQKDVLTRDPECAAVALELLGHEHAEDHISEIVQFLTFRRKFYWEGTGFIMRPVGEIEHYPAATALFEIGKPALPALLSVAAEGPNDSLKFRNAVNTIMDIHREHLPDGVRFLRRAALKETDTKRSSNLNAAVAMADSFCDKESRDACIAAAHESLEPGNDEGARKTTAPLTSIRTDQLEDSAGETNPGGTFSAHRSSSRSWDGCILIERICIGILLDPGAIATYGCL